MRGSRVLAFVLGFACLVAGILFNRSARAQQSFTDAFWQFRASSDFDYSIGRYGATSDTEVVYLSAILRASKGPWMVQVVAPYLWLSGPSLLLDEGAGGSVSTGRPRAVSGPGDVILSGRYSLESLWSRGLFIDFTLKVKIPTASFADGLGTGKPDESLQLDIAQAFGHVEPFITFGYRFTGSPPGYDLRNVVYGSGGVQYVWSNTVATGVYFDCRQSALRTLANPLDAATYVNIRFARAWSLNVYALKGFSSNSPAAGGGLMLSYRWP